MAEPRKRCLYEVLGVSRDCPQDEIRSAYRRLALQLHPDKLAQSTGKPSSADATAAFQELLHAYEVLSDPKERSWYDSHRSQILFSDPNPKSSSSPAFFDLDIFSFFSNSAFSGFSDSGKGFYKVYGDLFAKLYNQEMFFVKELGLPPDSVSPAPLIGNLESPYSQVTAFYNYWLGFCTVIDFGWVDEFDSSLGPNRRSRRAMEEENKKKRKKARREYNDTVRNLAAFVKKRDKRVRDMQLKKNLEEEKRREEEKRKKEERKKMERARLYEEPEWAKIDDKEEERILGFEETDGDDDRKRKEKVGEEFYCVVCNKKFKSDKQWKNHEQSKKHRDKVAELRVSFQEEEEEFEEVLLGKDEDGVGVGFDYEPQEEVEDSDVLGELHEEFRDDFGLEEEGNERGNLEEEEQKLGSDDETSILEAMISGHKGKKSDFLGHDDSLTNEVGHTDDNDLNGMKHDNRRRRRNRASRRRGGVDDDDEVERDGTNGTMKDDGEVQRDGTNGTMKDDEVQRDGSNGTMKDDGEVEREGTSGSMKDDGEVQNQDKDATSCSSEGVAARSKGDRVGGKNQKHKKQQVDDRGPAKKDSNVSKNSSKGRKQKATTKASSNACETCGESFDTRNKLFAHLGDTGHAMLKSR